MAGLLRGDVPFGFTSLVLATPLIRDGKARALGLSAPTRSPVFPALPTISEQGFAGFQMGDWLGLLAPADTPAPVIARLAAAAKEALEQPALAPRLEALGLTPTADGPEAFARFLAAERAEMRDLIAAEGIRLE